MVIKFLCFALSGWWTSFVTAHNILESQEISVRWLVSYLVRDLLWDRGRYLLCHLQQWCSFGFAHFLDHLVEEPVLVLEQDIRLVVLLDPASIQNLQSHVQQNNRCVVQHLYTLLQGKLTFQLFHWLSGACRRCKLEWGKQWFGVQKEPSIWCDSGGLQTAAPVSAWYGLWQWEEPVSRAKACCADSDRQEIRDLSMYLPRHLQRPRGGPQSNPTITPSRHSRKLPSFQCHGMLCKPHKK